MRRLLLAIAVIALAGSSASGQVRAVPGEGCLAELRAAYRDDLFTYGGAIKLWWVRLKDRFTNLSAEEEGLIKARVKLESGLRCYEAATNSKALTLDLSPTEFKGVFNGILRDRALKLEPLPI